MVVVLIAVGGPPHGVLGIAVHDDILVLRRAAGIDAGHHIHGIKLGDLANLIASQLLLGFLSKEFFIGGVVNDLVYAGNTVLFQVDHVLYSFTFIVNL